MGVDTSDDKWERYYEAGRGRAVRPLLTTALARIDREPGVAVDLGCGDGTETLALLTAGWTVHAVDSSPDGIARTEYRGRAHADRLTTHRTRLEDFEPPTADLIYSGWTLPFCHPESFDALWARLRGAMAPQGLLAVNLFGVRDDWASEQGMTFRTLEQAQDMAAGLVDVSVTETEEDGQSFSGPKHWHEISIMARSACSRPRNPLTDDHVHDLGGLGDHLADGQPVQSTLDHGIGQRRRLQVGVADVG